MRIGCAQRALPGETVCGDAYATIDTPAGCVVALADGLGHGPAAAEAAQTFCRFVREHVGEPLASVMSRASEALAGSRGAAAAIISVDTTTCTLRFVGIGNIETRSLSRHPLHAVCLPGIVGRPLRKISVFEFAADPGDLVVLHTDGVSTRFDLEPLRGLGPDETARRLLETHGKPHDDASCVAIEV